MAEALVDGTGSGYQAAITSDNRLKVEALLSGAAVITSVTGSESWIKGGSIQTYAPIGVGSSYVINYVNVITSGIVPISGIVGVEFSNDYVGVYQSGTNWAVSGAVAIKEELPTSSFKNNPAYKFEYTAQNKIGSIVTYIGAGSYVQILTWANGSVITNVGSNF